MHEAEATKEKKVSSDYNNGENVLVRFHEEKRMPPSGARLFLLTPDDSVGVWIPRSQIRHVDHDAGELWIPVWLAEDRGLEYE